MLTIKEIKSKKTPYNQLDNETKDHLYDLFRRYVVRKQISDTNKELTSLFKQRYGLNPRAFSMSFSEFNSAFVNASLIRELSYDEIHTTYLSKMSEDQFNYHLNQKGNPFERKIALICFSMRPSERIANRLDFPVMVAYADMQTKVLEKAKKHPNKPLNEIFIQTSREIHSEYLKQHGEPINKSKIAETRTDYKSLGKKCAPVWNEMLQSYQAAVDECDPRYVSEYVRTVFAFTDRQLTAYDEKINPLKSKAASELYQDKLWAEQQMEEHPSTYIPADCDEMFSTAHELEVYKSILSDPLKAVLGDYLKDPIFVQEEKKKS